MPTAMTWEGAAAAAPFAELNRKYISENVFPDGKNAEPAFM